MSQGGFGMAGVRLLIFCPTLRVWREMRLECTAEAPKESGFYPQYLTGERVHWGRGGF